MPKMFLLILIIFTGISKADEAMVSPSSVEMINQKYKSEIKPIIEKSCFDCHSNTTTFPWYHKIPGIKQLIDNDIKEGREEVDFSNDFPFQGKDPIDETVEHIGKEIEEGDMPPFLYNVGHPDKKLSKEDKEKVLKWVSETLETLKSEKK